MMAVYYNVIMIFMLKDLEWFMDRVGFTILRNKTEIEITSDAMAKKLYELQDDKYNFADKVRVHYAPKAECESCSA